MRRRKRSPFAPLADLGSMLGGAVVLGVVVAYTGPFLAIISIVASLIFGPVVLLRLLTPKSQRENFKRWG